jgi:hypothetical protein
MLAVTLICSDNDCDHELVEVVWSLEQLELMVCDSCSCCLQAVDYSTAVDIRPGIQHGLSRAA